VPAKAGQGLSPLLHELFASENTQQLGCQGIKHSSWNIASSKLEQPVGTRGERKRNAIKKQEVELIFFVPVSRQINGFSPGPFLQAARARTPSLSPSTAPPAAGLVAMG
jgi:hypothetical protein